MKKYLSIIASAMLLCFTGCSEEECDHPQGGGDSTNVVVGTWYESAANEEIKFFENGVYYDRYANYERCAYSEGQWEYDAKNKRLTYRYPFLDQTQFVDWTVKNLTVYGFTITSDKNGSHVLEKIVESYEMKVGETRIVQFGKDNADFQYASYSSNNERIATVSADGTITAQGEKGITYIKVSSGQTNVWVKVTVGDNCADMWYDYVGLIGLDYSNMRKALSRLGDPYSGEDGYSFGFIHQVHDVADVTKVFICPECGIVTAIQLLIKESVPEAEILSYMNSRYYKFVENGPYVFYSSVEDKEASKAIVAYNKSEKCVIFNEAQHFLHYPHVKDLWADFVPLFGSDKDQVKSKMAEYGYSFLMSDYNYSKDGSDYYNITNNAYAQMVGFVFNPDLKVSEFWVYMDSKSDPYDIYDYLCAKYTENESETTDYSLIFYNDDKSLRVTFDLKNAAVVYTNLTMKQHEANTEILGNYYEGLGLTHDQIVDKFGAPYSDDGSKMFYIVGSEYVNLSAFMIDAETGKCNNALLTINENVATSTIVDYLNSKYTVFENGTAADGSQYAWTNGPSVAESTFGVIYYPDDRMVVYVPFGASANVKALTRAVDSFTADIDLVKQVGLKTSELLSNINKKKESIRMYKSRLLENITSSFNK